MGLSNIENGAARSLGPVAQQAEHESFKLVVVGSSPTRLTNFYRENIVYKYFDNDDIRFFKILGFFVITTIAAVTIMGIS